jgi:uncharacterized protein with HEPN domain
MLLEVKKHLEDARLAVDRIARFTSQRTFDDYKGDELVKAAVERQFEIIGEAVNRLTKVAPDIVKRISQFRRIISFRNILIHGYDAIDDAIVWDVVEQYLPVLQAEIDHLLRGP